ncbi:MAG: xanthine phosphoribosyltransferase, partial [Firmicutes bacterium]|nr:xanthine phosphoribosyltransferase [Bacillota bacterium]
ITVAKKHLSPGEHILIIDDFLAHGEASKALCSIVEQAGAEVAGIGIVISKDFQGGKTALEDMGYRVETLASVKSMDNGKVEFCE